MDAFLSLKIKILSPPHVDTENAKPSEIVQLRVEWWWEGGTNDVEVSSGVFSCVRIMQFMLLTIIKIYV